MCSSDLRHASCRTFGQGPQLGPSPDTARCRPRIYSSQSCQIYHPTGEWLVGEKETALELRHEEIGERRRRKVCTELMWAIILTKENLWKFINRGSEMDPPPEVFSHLELLELPEEFLDRTRLGSRLGSSHHAAAGYQERQHIEPMAEMSLTRQCAVKDG